jgi:hypothetical protein
MDIKELYGKVYSIEVEIMEIEPILFFRNNNRYINKEINVIEKEHLVNMSFIPNYSNFYNSKKIIILDQVKRVHVFPFLKWNETDDDYPIYIRNMVEFIRIEKPNIIIKLDKQAEIYTINYYYKIGIEESHIYKALVIEMNNIMNNKKFINEINVLYDKNVVPRSMVPYSFIQNSDYNKIELFKYQINDIIWMQRIENGDYNVEFNDFPVKYNGGNIISEMGLGKSIIVLSFIVNETNPYDKYIIGYSDKCNYFYKRGALIHKSCDKKVKENNLYCTEHTKRNFHDKMKLNLSNELINRDFSSFFNGKFITNASLIICPEHIGDQWCMEYYNKIRSIKMKRVLVILTIYQYNNLTLSDVLFADIIILSYNLIYSTIRCNSNRVIIPNHSTVNLRLNEIGLTLSHFHYKRIFLDEIHQYQKSRIETLIENIQRDYTWNITGTPFINGLEGYLKLITNNTNFNNIQTDNITALVNNFDILFRRNTKENISENLLSVYSKQVKLLEFTKEERDIYDAFIKGNENPFSDKMRKLCCDPELYSNMRRIISSCKSLSEIRDVIFKELTNEISEIDYTINFLKSLILTHEQGQETNQENIRGLRTSLTVNLKNKDNKEKTITYMQEHIMEPVEMCCICLDDISDVCITKCGHKYCHECINNFIKCTMRNDKFKCPQCNTLLQDNQVYYVKDVPEYNSELVKIIQNVKSTKTGNIIYYIKHELKPTDKIIIFSQWDELLHKVGNRISEYLNVLYCSGSLYQKTKAIKEFNNVLENQVIMLSSKNSASGINLSIANKIIFIEPIKGIVKFREETELQATGRANRIGNKNKCIEIIKFIVKDTIEQEIYNETN